MTIPQQKVAPAGDKTLSPPGAIWHNRRMPIVSAIPVNPLADGRQSDRAMRVRRGVQRLLDRMGMSLLPELCLPTGRRADLVALGPKGEIWIVEIKTSVEDLRADRKWPDYRLHCDRLYFATHPDVPAGIFPEECGFIVSDGYDAEILREAPEHRLSAPLRKSLTLRIARAAATRITAAEIAGVTVPALEREGDCD